MGSAYIPYKRLLSRMAISGHNSSSIGKLLGISYSTMRNKMKGQAPFTLEEALRVRQILAPEEKLEDLFEKTAQNEKKASRARVTVSA
jgi:hypothetical protein